MRRLIYIYFFFLGNLFPFIFNILRSESLELSAYNNPPSKINFKFKNENKNLVKIEFEKYLESDLINSENDFLKILLSADLKKKEDFSLEIDSDIQYIEEDIFRAEGNVIVFLNNGRLEADKISYDKKKKLFKAVGNLEFYKGDQYFEASDLFYDLDKDEGYIKRIYGILKFDTLDKDIELKNVKDNEKNAFQSFEEDEKEDILLIDSANVRLLNEFEDKKRVKPKDFALKIPGFKRLRFKSEELILESKKIKSDLVYFTNDPINKPQLILETKMFTAQIVNGKTQIIGEKNWIMLDDKLKFPIGRRNIIDRDPITKWGFGSDFEEKDGWYLFRGYEGIQIAEKFFLKLQPYFLLQRGIKGTSRSFREEGSSIFTDKKKTGAKFSDYTALDIEFYGKINKWGFGWNSYLNSLNTSRLNQSLRSKIFLNRTINLKCKNQNINCSINLIKELDNENKTLNQFKQDEEKKDLYRNLIKELDNENKTLNQFKQDEEKKDLYRNLLDIKIYSSFRETVSRGYSGSSEIHFGSGFNFVNRHKWDINNLSADISFIYDYGHFNAESINKNELIQLSRNVLGVKSSYRFPIWKKENTIKSINSNYIYSPIVIEEGFYWNSGIHAGVFYYSNGDSQSGANFSTGPQITLGSFTNDFLDYTRLNITGSVGFENGESPFVFDNIGSSANLGLSIEQQLIKALMLSFSTSINLENGEFGKKDYGLDIKRRAYSVGAYFDSSFDSIGIRFNIFNFDYPGISSTF